MKVNVVSIILCSVLVSCTSSYVYSPSLNLPAEPMRKDDVHATIGVEALNETSPRSIGDKFISPGLQSSVRYGYSKNFSMQAKGWISFRNDGSLDNRTGLSLTGTYLLNDSTEQFRYAIVPFIGCVLNKNSIDGGAAGTWFALWAPETFHLKPYAALGAGFGWYDLLNLNKRYGAGALLNLGIAINALNNLSFNFELIGTSMYNRYDETLYFTLSPAISMTYRF